jgi:hypothetical protein
MENTKNMCLIKYSSLEESFLAMAYLHDAELYGRYLHKIYDIYLLGKCKFLLLDQRYRIDFTTFNNFHFE